MINPDSEGTRRRLQNLNVPAEVIADIERTRGLRRAMAWHVRVPGTVQVDERRSAV
jgi:Cu(I)/Ag(I) efflux system membrane fusion protein